MIEMLIAAALSATAQPPARPAADLGGIWEGTVGTLPVRACFTQTEDGAFGAYYYLSRLQAIGLVQQDGRRDAFDESGTGGAQAGWRIERADATGLTARWTGGGRTLPVRLRRVARQSGEESPCADVAFHRPRLAGVRTVSTRATVDGVAYTKLTLDTRGRFASTVETFALDGSGPAVRRINRAMGEELAGDPPAWFACVSGSLEQMPYEGETNDRFEPVMISRRWLSVAAHNDSSCGGAHPNASNVYLTYDLTTGAEAEPLDWFTTRAVRRERYGGGAGGVSRTLQPAFRAFILSGWRADPQAAECDEVIRSQSDWNVGITRAGFVFTPSLPHVVQACFEEFTIPFDRIRPWLTSAAVQHVRALQAERPRPSR